MENTSIDGKDIFCNWNKLQHSSVLFVYTPKKKEVEPKISMDKLSPKTTMECKDSLEKERRIDVIASGF